MVYQESTKTKSVFGISVPNFLVFSWYFIGNLKTLLLKFGYYPNSMFPVIESLASYIP